MSKAYNSQHRNTPNLDINHHIRDIVNIMKSTLVTGSAGFIGANLVKRLFKDMKEGTIVGVDNLNSYYDVSLKEYRLRELEELKPASIKS